VTEFGSFDNWFVASEGRLEQTDNHVSTSSLNFYRPDAPPDAPSPTNSVLKANDVKVGYLGQLLVGFACEIAACTEPTVHDIGHYA